MSCGSVQFDRALVVNGFCWEAQTKSVLSKSIHTLLSAASVDAVVLGLWEEIVNKVTRKHVFAVPDLRALTGTGCRLKRLLR